MFQASAPRIPGKEQQPVAGGTTAADCSITISLQIRQEDSGMHTTFGINFLQAEINNFAMIITEYRFYL